MLALADHLPSEASEALLELATGGKPEVAKPASIGTDPFAHPDAQRRFRVMNNIEAVPQIPDSDVELVIAQTGATADAAKAALIDAKGDLAAAIMQLASK